jgi:hypothetical protein
MSEQFNETNVNSDIVERLLTNRIHDETNPEIRDLGTHAAGAVNLHKTIVTEQPVTIEPGDAPGGFADESNKK